MSYFNQQFNINSISSDLHNNNNYNNNNKINNYNNYNNIDTIDSTLLSRISRQICVIGTIFYSILMFPSFFHGIEKINEPIPSSDVISPNSRLIIGSLCGFYFAAVAWNLSRLFTFKYLKRASTNGITRLNLFIGIIASTSSLYTTIFGWGGMKEDYFGVQIPWSIWVEWMTCAPILVLMITAFDTKPYLSNDDIRAILHAEVMIVAGLFIHINLANLPAIFPTLFLILSCVCCKTPFELVLKTYNELKLIKKLIVQRSGNKELLAQKLTLTSRRYDLSRLLAFIFPLFAIAYFIRALKYITNEQCTIVFMFLGISTKVIYMEVASNAYLDEFHPSNIELLLLLKSDLERITYLKFIFHEARIPLQSLSLGLEILNNLQYSSISSSSIPSLTNNLTTDLNDTIQHINNSTKSITEIFDNILLLHKINDKNITLKYKKINLFNVLNKLYYNFITDIELKSIKFTIHIDSNVPHEIICDSYYLLHVLSIYLSNSIQFTPENGAIQLYVFYPINAYNEQSNYICLEIHDNGSSIEEKDMNSIFQPYLEIQSGDTLSHRGTGIGLALCREIIQLHGGDVYVKSSQFGCVFGCMIPLTLPEYVPLQKTNQSEINLFDDSNSQLSTIQPILLSTDQIYVLIADDSQINRKMLQRILFNKNIQSDTSENGQDAVHMYAKNPNKYSVIFMDNMMPEMNGLNASKQLREMGYENLIIGLTGNVADDDKKQFILSGADLVLSKPLKIDELDALIKFINYSGPKSLFQENKIITKNDKINNYKWIHNQ